MNNFRRKIFLLLTIITLSSNSNATSGNDLIKKINAFKYFYSENAIPSNVDFIEVAKFMSYVDATADTSILFNILCSNQHITKQQMYFTVVKYFDANPHRWHDPASLLIIESLNDAFCK